MTERMTVAQLRAAKKGGKRVRGSVRCEVDGIKFSSKLEMRHYLRLKMMERAGLISDLRIQVPFDLMGSCGAILTPTGRGMLYVADFVYTDRETGGQVVADAKGHQTEVSVIKLAILAAQGVKVKLLR